MPQSLWKTLQRSFKKSNIEPPYNPAASLWGIYLKEIKSLSEKDICMFIAALFTIVKTQK